MSLDEAVTMSGAKATLERAIEKVRVVVKNFGKSHWVKDERIAFAKELRDFADDLEAAAAEIGEGREVYVSGGIASDDEGNTWTVGRHPEGTYYGREASNLVRAGARSRKYRSSRMEMQAAALRRALARDKGNRVLAAALKELDRGNPLDDDLRSKVMGLLDPVAASLFESVSMSDLLGGGR